MSSATMPGWSFRANDYRSFLNFRDRAFCLQHAFEVAARCRLQCIVLLHPDGTEEVVTRDEYESTRTN